MNDYYVQPTDYKIDFVVPFGYTLHSDLEEEVEMDQDHVLYKLSGKNRLDIELNIELKNSFSIFSTANTKVITNIKNNLLTENIKTDVLQRQLDFIEELLGKSFFPFLMSS